MRHEGRSADARARKVGLARALSKLGYCSRSQAAELIRAGRVRLNGKVRRDPETPVNMDHDRIAVDGAAVVSASPVYLMLNKPRGIVTTADDEKGRDTVYSVLPSGLPWLGPVGRLDKASEGLLLLTNDSEWAAHVTDPDSHLDKTYHVQVRSSMVRGRWWQMAHRGEPASAVIDLVPSTIDEVCSGLVAGVRCEGELLRAKSVRVLRRGEKNMWLEIVLDEGRNRQIRRMLEALGIEVLRLVRVAIGPLGLGDLSKGATRALTDAEKAALDTALGMESTAARDRARPSR